MLSIRVALLPARSVYIGCWRFAEAGAEPGKDPAGSFFGGLNARCKVESSSSLTGRLEARYFSPILHS